MVYSKRLTTYKINGITSESTTYKKFNEEQYPIDQRISIIDQINSTLTSKGWAIISKEEYDANVPSETDGA